MKKLYFLNEQQYNKLLEIQRDIESPTNGIQKHALRNLINEIEPFPVGDIENPFREFDVSAVRALTGDRDFDEMLDQCIETTSTKGQEYTGGSPDRLNNFRQAAADIGLKMEQVWYVFFNKHLRAVQSYIKNGCHVKSNEPISSRIMDCIVYLLLFHKMSKEIELTHSASVLRDESAKILSTKTPLAHHPV